MAATPGVQAASMSWGAFPMSGDDEWLFWLDGKPKPSTRNEMNWVIDYVVDPDYLKIMQTRLRSGRFFTPQDDENAPKVVVVDEVLAQNISGMKIRSASACSWKLASPNSQRKSWESQTT